MYKLLLIAMSLMGASLRAQAMPDYYLDVERLTIGYRAMFYLGDLQDNEIPIKLYFHHYEPVIKVHRSKLVQRQKTTLSGIGTRINKDWILYNPWGPEDWAVAEPWMIFRETGDNPSALQKEYEDAIYVIQQTYVNFNRGPSRHYILKKGQYIEPRQSHGDFKVGDRLCSNISWPRDGFARAFFPNGKFVISDGFFNEMGKMAEVKDYTRCPERPRSPPTPAGGGGR
ncbi:MAG: hypothetical protein KDD43_04470 [Bdellovibrionales bacterium]|nr:hypothetical protein [Bdellovibrionales bacterium]